MTAAHATDLAKHVLSELGEEQCGVVLYGSRARGTSRDDSDIDVLQLVEKNPRSYAIDSMNVTVYTAAHLSTMATRGSLFVRHLIDEGIVLSDPYNFVSTALGAYQEPPTYARLKTELRVLLDAMSKPDAAQYRPLLDNLARFTVRSALYVRTAELGKPIFDLEAAAHAADLPKVAALLRGSIVQDIDMLIGSGIQLLDVPLPKDVPGTLQAITVWAIGRYPLVSKQLEHAIAGNAQIDYSLLSLPPS
jgi:predicted nucleotidyltransferase